jgi:hypothetical protein
VAYELCRPIEAATGKLYEEYGAPSDDTIQIHGDNLVFNFVFAVSRLLLDDAFWLMRGRTDFRDEPTPCAP